MFSMGRDRRLPFGRRLGTRQPRLPDPDEGGDRGRRLAAIPFVLDRPGSAAILAIGATGLIYLSYFLCNLGVFVARTRGWPHKGAWFSLGSWGTIINLVALLWGGAMIINFALWQIDMFGALGTVSYTLPATSTVGLRGTVRPDQLAARTLRCSGATCHGCRRSPLFELDRSVSILIDGRHLLLGRRSAAGLPREAVSADERHRRDHDA